MIPSELNATNKRFILKALNEKAKFEHYRNSFLWLADAGVALPTYNVEEPRLPLKLGEQRNLFKLFMSDVGLLASQYAANIGFSYFQIDNNAGDYLSPYLHAYVYRKETEPACPIFH